LSEYDMSRSVDLSSSRYPKDPRIIHSACW